MTNYTLNFINNSNISGDLCVYQTDPSITDPSVMSLAWFTQRCHPTTHAKYTWGIDYSFVWSQTGKLQAGIVFDATQVWLADLKTTNKISLKKESGAYTFYNQTKGDREGTLFIDEDSSIPSVPEASVGIGMNGSGTFVVQARPNMHPNFTPHPLYWVTFGNFIKGQVLDISDITDKAEIKFPAGVYSMTAILNEDNTWSVMPTNQVNQEIVEKNAKNIFSVFK